MHAVLGVAALSLRAAALLPLSALRMSAGPALSTSAGPPSSAADVLSFWFGDEWAAGTADGPEYTKVHAKRWFMGGAAVDAQARAFAPLIRAAGAGSLDGAAWAARDGLVAQLVLLDQLSRNAFRGTDEAFAFDAPAVSVARRLVASLDAPSELPAPAALFVVTCMMHSEDLELHDAAAAFCEAHVAVSRSELLADQARSDLPAHSAVLRRFGRYPHRNEFYSRATTPEEARWLASDECPGWAKSQRPRPKG